MMIWGNTCKISNAAHNIKKQQQIVGVWALHCKITAKLIVETL